jgi:hypothetical protein
MNHPETEEDLERVITALVARKKAADFDSAEWRMADRQLDGLRFTYEAAGPIIEDLDWYS